MVSPRQHVTDLGSDEARSTRDAVYGQDGDHESSFGHELIAGAASFEAMKAFEDHQRKEGTYMSPLFHYSLAFWRSAT